MEMEQLMRNLEEELEQIDLLTKERDNLKIKYDNAKVQLKSLKDSCKETSCSNDIKVLKEERDNLKDRYEDSKVYIGEFKDKIDLLESKSKSIGSVKKMISFQS